MSVKNKIGGYDPIKEYSMIESQKRSLNLFDFNSSNDCFLLDQYSDATEFGGESDCTLLHTQENQNKYCNKYYSSIYV